MKRLELLKKCLELGGIRDHKEKKAELAKIRQMKSSELLEKINELEKEAQLVEESKCRECLNQQRIQRKIDEKTHNQRVLDSMIRDLVCIHCKHANLAQDGDHTVCADCGTLQPPSVSYDKY